MNCSDNSSGLKPNIYIDPTAVVASDIVCQGNVWIGPNVEIGHGCTISPGAVIGLPGPEGFTGKVVIGEKVWIGPSAYIEPGTTIDDECVIGPFVLIRQNTKIAHGARIGVRCTILDNVTIGQFANLIAEVYICEYSTLGAHCQISPGVTLVNDKYPPTALELLGPTIGECAILGAKSIIWPGVNIGYHAMVASLSEVKEDVNDYILVRGCPAKQVCDVRQIRMKHKEKWVYPYPWMRLNLPGVDLTKPEYEPKRNRWGQKK